MKKLTLDADQVEATQAIFKSWKEGHIPYADCCVAFGKSLLLAHLMNLCMKQGKRALQIVPSKELCESNYREAFKYIDSPGELGIVCAGLSKKQYRKQGVIGTYQTIVNNLSRLGSFNLLMIDEADLVNPKQETSIRKIVDNFRKLNPRIKIVGVTGSPYRLDQGQLHHDTEHGPALFTECCYRADILKRVDAGRLVMPFYVKTGVHVNLEGVPLAGRDYNNEIMGVKFDAIVNDAVLDMKAQFARYDIETSIIFASSVENAKHIIELWGNHSEMRLLTANTSQHERRTMLEWLEHGKGNRYIVNVGILIRGFNYPALQSIVFFTATKSLSKYVQCGGRVLRFHGSKEFGYIIDYGTNVERLGKIEAIEPPSKPKKRGDAPKKMCGNCFTPNILSARKCKECDMVFVSEDESGNYSMKSQEEIEAEKSLRIDEVTSITYSKTQSKKSGIDMIECSFYKDYELKHKHYLCLNHKGKAKTIADVFFKSLFVNEKDYYKLGTAGRTVDNAEMLLNKMPHFFKVPSRIATRKQKNSNFRELLEIAWTS